MCTFAPPQPFPCLAPFVGWLWYFKWSLGMYSWFTTQPCRNQEKRAVHSDSRLCIPLCHLRCFPPCCCLCADCDTSKDYYVCTHGLWHSHAETKKNGLFILTIGCAYLCTASAISLPAAICGLILILQKITRDVLMTCCEVGHAWQYNPWGTVIFHAILLYCTS